MKGYDALDVIFGAACSPLRTRVVSMALGAARRNADPSSQTRLQACRALKVAMPAPLASWPCLPAFDRPCSNTGALLGARLLSGMAWGRSQGPLHKRWTEEDARQAKSIAKALNSQSPIILNLKTAERMPMKQYSEMRQTFVLLVRSDTDKEELLLEEVVMEAEAAGLDPVMVHLPTDKNDVGMPVVRFMDSGKKRHDLSKRAKESKKQQAVNSVKEIKLGYNIGQHDLETRLRQAREFLAKGHRVKLFTVLKRGEEHDTARERIDAALGTMTDLGTVEPATAQAHVVKGVIVPAKNLRDSAQAEKGDRDQDARVSRRELKAKEQAAAAKAAQEATAKEQALHAEPSASEALGDERGPPSTFGEGRSRPSAFGEGRIVRRGSGLADVRVGEGRGGTGSAERLDRGEHAAYRRR